MAADGVVADVLYPTRGKSVFRIDYEPEISEAAARVYNDWMIEYCQEAPDRLWGQAILPLWNIENAILEMERCRDAGLAGVTTWMVPPESLRFSSDHYERFWDAAEATGTPVSMHINNGFGPYAEAAESVRTRNAGDALSELSFTATGHKKIAADTLTDIICSGVLERHPGLKIIVAETEIGWIPFWLEELDKRLRRKGDLPLQPSDYFYRQCYATFSDDPVGGQLLSRWGTDSFLWANDYPHPGPATPGSSPGRSSSGTSATCPAGRGRRSSGRVSPRSMADHTGAHARAFRIRRVDERVVRGAGRLLRRYLLSTEQR